MIAFLYLQIITIQESIKLNNKLNENKSNRLIDIQHTFEMEIRNNNFAKHLKKIFKKKLKIPKVKSDDDNGIIDIEAYFVFFITFYVFIFTSTIMFNFS